MRALISLTGIAAEFSACHCEGSAGDLLTMTGIVAVLVGLGASGPFQWLADSLCGGRLPAALPNEMLVKNA